MSGIELEVTRQYVDQYLSFGYYTKRDEAVSVVKSAIGLDSRYTASFIIEHTARVYYVCINGEVTIGTSSGNLQSILQYREIYLPESCLQSLVCTVYAVSMDELRLQLHIIREMTAQCGYGGYYADAEEY